MRVIPPLKITDSILTSSTVSTEADYNEFAMNTTYGVGEYAQITSGLEILTLDVAPATAWAAGDIITGQSSGKTCVAVSQVTSKTYYVRERTGSFTLGEEIGVTGTAAKLADQGAAHPTITAATDNVHKVYQSLAASNSKNYPPTDVLKDSPVWAEIGPTNKWAMFDAYRNTKTTGASPLTVVLTPGVRVNTIALMGLVADSVTIAVTDGGVTVYTKTESLVTRQTAGWYDYFFGEFDSKSALLIYELPPFKSAVITVAITSSSGNASCGACIIGNSQYIGKMKPQPSCDTLNFSTVDRDTFGNATLVPRPNKPKTSQTLLLEKEYLNKVRAIKDEVNAAPAVWYGVEDETSDFFESFLILGYYQEFSFAAINNNKTQVTLELEEI
jgi:hypothetical protein